MAKKTDWHELTHEEKIAVLSQKTVSQIIEDYECDGQSDAEFKALLEREVRLWDPSNVGKFKETGAPPTKDVVLGAWRDLDRSEAVLELIDNSIDVWLQRREKYPRKTASELNIYIDIDAKSRQLTYEDNAGGVSLDKISNLVVPGFSDTTALSATIGSYKTGGKKAIFRLGTAVQILTRYWNPAETSDDAVSIHLDEGWIHDAERYKFLYAPLKHKGVIERGQTKYVIQLREEPLGGSPWYGQPSEMEKLIEDVRTAYTLILARNPSIHIYVQDRTNPLEPKEELYDFSGAHGRSIDIRPQLVRFNTNMEYDGKSYPIQIEIVLGCRKTSGVKAGRTGGIDLYGNDRLFVAYDQIIFSDLLPSGNVRNMVRGFVNIKGPNVFIPWDTHKRHVNLDREIILLLTKHPLIRELFENWKAAYSVISKSPTAVRTNTALEKIFDRTEKDIFIPHRTTLTLDPKQKRRAVSKPAGFFVPKVPRSPRRKDNIVTVSVRLSIAEARLLAAFFAIEGDLTSKAVLSELGTEIRDEMVRRASKARK